MRVFPLFSFKIMERELYSSHNVLIFFCMPGYFSQSYPLKDINTSFAILNNRCFCFCFSRGWAYRFFDYAFSSDFFGNA